METFELDHKKCAHQKMTFSTVSPWNELDAITKMLSNLEWVKGCGDWGKAGRKGGWTLDTVDTGQWQTRKR